MLLLWNDQVNTIAKHLSAYSGPEGYCGDVRAYCPPPPVLCCVCPQVSFGTQSRFSFTANLTQRAWREFFLPSWRAMAVDAGVTGFMSRWGMLPYALRGTLCPCKASAAPHVDATRHHRRVGVQSAAVRVQETLVVLPLTHPAWHNSLYKRGTLCPCEAYGMRSRSIGMMPTARCPPPPRPTALHCSYMAVSLDGGPSIPDSANPTLLTDIIRTDWNWVRAHSAASLCPEMHAHLPAAM